MTLEVAMLSFDLENIACALEHMAGSLTEEHAAYISQACANLHALAERAERLEDVPLCVTAA